MEKHGSRFVLGIVIFTAGLVVLYCTALQSRPTRKSVPVSEAFAGVTEVRVRSGGTCHRTPEAETHLFTLRGDECRDLIAHLNVTETGSSCRCCGDYTFEFYEGRKRVASISLHHWDHMRWVEGKRNGDAALDEKSLSYLKDLMQSHGVKDISWGCESR